MTPTPHSPLAKVRQAVEANGLKVTPQKNGFRFPCPAHGGSNPTSCSVVENEAGGVHLTCFSQDCSEDSIAAALGLSRRDLMPEAKLNGAGALTANQPTFIYHRVDDSVFARQIRVNNPNAKYKWDRKLPKGETPPLYGLPWLLKDRESEVFITEGARDAETMKSLGFQLATTSPYGGIAELRDDHLETLAGRNVTILCDNDDTGLKRQLTHAKQLHDSGARVRVVPPFNSSKGKGGDVSDWANDRARDGLEPQAITEMLDDILNRALDFDPEHLPEWRDHPDPNDRNRGFTAEELMKEEIPPLRWIIPEILPEGLTILAGPPKIGKSYTALNIAVAVAKDGLALGSKEVEPGHVFYGAFEDGKRRLQERIRTVLADGTPAPANLYFRLDLPPLTGKIKGDAGETGAEDEILRHLSTHPETTLVVLDVLGRIRGPQTGRDTPYQVETDLLARLHKIALDKRIAVVVVHHTRKEQTYNNPFADASGTYGLTGAADTIIILNRDPRREQGALLHVTGRDVAENTYALDRIEEGGWKVIGKAFELAATEQRQEVVDALRHLGVPVKSADVAEYLDIGKDAARKRLDRLCKDGSVEKAGKGLYTLSGCPERGDDES